MKDALIIVILAVILSLAVWYIVRSKRKGTKCIGCPTGGDCPLKTNGECCCGSKYSR